MNNDEMYHAVVENLSRLIAYHLSACSYEQRAPGGDIDSSDQKISDCKRRAEQLRRIRQEFEDIMSGVV